MSLADLPEFSPEQRAQQLEFEREQEQPHIALTAFWRRLNAIPQADDQRRPRLRLNLFEARICAMGLRLGKRKRRSDPPSSIGNTREMDRRRSRLLHRIENLSRKLQRQFEAAAGRAASSQFSQLFADYRDAIYARLFHWRPTWFQSPSVRKSFIVILDEACKLACQGLNEMGYTETTPAEIRPLIRRFLAYSRRGRIRFSVRDLSDRSPFTRLFLANFIVDSWAKRDRKQNHATLREGESTTKYVKSQAA